MLQGFKTVIFNVLAAIATWVATTYGIEVDPQFVEQINIWLASAFGVENATGLALAIVVTLMAIGNLILRFITKTPIFKKEKDL